jgi:hypothetical protein
VKTDVQLRELAAMIEIIRSIVTVVRRNYRLFLLIPIFGLSTLTGCSSRGGSDDEVDQCAFLAVTGLIIFAPECWSSSSQTAATQGIFPLTTPTGLTAVSVSSDAQDPVISLSWDGPDDNDVVSGYKIYRDGLQIQDLRGTSFSDAGLNTNIQYCYTVSAYDAASNESAQSDAACVTASWNIAVVDDKVTPQWTAIALNASDHVHIGYQAGGYAASGQFGDLKHAMNATGVWSSEIIGTSAHLGAVSLAVDSTDRMHLAYDSDGKLIHATLARGIWTTEVVGDVGAVVENAKIAAIALDSSNALHVAYYDYPSGDLGYANNSVGSWSTQTFDAQGNVGRDVAIAVDAVGWAHIMYYDAMSRDLNYTTNASGVWTTETVDSQGQVGTGIAIAVDSAGKVHISYTDDTNHDLKYATNASGAWRTYVVDSAGVSGIFLSPSGDTGIAVDSIGTVHISYQTNAALKYARNR